MGRDKADTYEGWSAPGVRITRWISRDELLLMLDRHYWVHPPVHPTTLRNWEREQVLPHPHVRRHIDGLTRALYPVWAVTMIMELRHEQAKGRSLQELRDYMRGSARHASYLARDADPNIPREHWRPPPPRIYADDLPPRADLLTHDQRDSLAEIIEMALMYQAAPTDDDPYAVRLSPFAQWVRDAVDAKLVLTGADGQRVTIPIPLDILHATD